MDSIFFVVGNSELGARAVCSILLGMNALDRKSVLLYFVFFLLFIWMRRIWWKGYKSISFVGMNALGAQAVYSFLVGSEILYTKTINSFFLN